jgi:hypothetical protein
MPRRSARTRSRARGRRCVPISGSTAQTSTHSRPLRTPDATVVPVPPSTPNTFAGRFGRERSLLVSLRSMPLTFRSHQIRRNTRSRHGGIRTLRCNAFEHSVSLLAGEPFANGAGMPCATTPARPSRYWSRSGDLVVVDGLTAHTVFRGECGNRFALGQAFP